MSFPSRIAAPLIVFLLVSAAAAPLLTLAQAASGIDRDFLRLTVFSTAVGAALVMQVFHRRLPYPAVIRRDALRPAVGAVAACGLFGAAMVALSLVEHAGWMRAGAAGSAASFVVFLFAQLIGAGAEEAGWRGLVQPLFETRLRPLPAALSTGALFAVGHAFMLPAVGPLAFLLFCVSAIGFSVTAATLTMGRTALARIMIATLFHFLTNMVTFALFADGDGSVLYFADTALAATLIAFVAWTWWSRSIRRGSQTSSLTVSG